MDRGIGVFLGKVARQGFQRAPVFVHSVDLALGLDECVQRGSKDAITAAEISPDAAGARNPGPEQSAGLFDADWSAAGHSGIL